MDIIGSLIISLALAMDCFAVAIACTGGLRNLGVHNYLIPALSFGMFQSSMFVAGLFTGEGVSRFIDPLRYWLAFILLSAIGLKMIFKRDEIQCVDERPMLMKPFVLLILSTATSIDALVAGFGMGMLGGRVFLPALIIGAVSFLMTLLGVGLGARLGRTIGKTAERCGGVILLAIAFKVLIFRS